MTAEDYAKEYVRKANETAMGDGPLTVDGVFVVSPRGTKILEAVPCDCGETFCTGFAMLMIGYPLNEHDVKDAPAEIEEAFRKANIEDLFA